MKSSKDNMRESLINNNGSVANFDGSNLENITIDLQAVSQERLLTSDMGVKLDNAKVTRATFFDKKCQASENGFVSVNDLIMTFLDRMVLFAQYHARKTAEKHVYPWFTTCRSDCDEPEQVRMWGFYFDRKNNLTLNDVFRVMDYMLNLANIPLDEVEVYGLCDESLVGCGKVQVDSERLHEEKTTHKTHMGWDEATNVNSLDCVKNTDAVIDEEKSRFLAVLRSKFGLGYSIGSYISYRKFKEEYRELFQRDLLVSKDQLEATLTKIGFLIGDECYAIDDILSSNDEERLNTEIDRRLEFESENTYGSYLFYNALLECFEVEINGKKERSGIGKIRDVNTLIQYLKQRYAGKFYFYETLFSRQPLKTINLYKDDVYYKIHDSGMCAISDIVKSFPNIDENTIVNSIKEDPRIICSKEMCASIDNYELDEHEWEKVRTYIGNELQIEPVISFKYLIDKDDLPCKEILRNLLNADLLAAFLMQKLSGAFNISTKGISLSEQKITLDTFLKSKWCDKKRITTEQIELDKPNNGGVLPQVYRYLFHNYTRLSLDVFEVHDWSTATIEKIDSELLKYMEGNDWCPIQRMPLNLLSAVYGAWNIYMLTWFLYEKSKLFDYCYLTPTIKNAEYGFIVRREVYSQKSYNDLVITFLSTAIKSHELDSVDKAYEFLKQEKIVSRLSSNDSKREIYDKAIKMAKRMK